MNLLAEIEGTKGENLTSKVLRYLVLQSPVLRDGFLDVLSTESPVGPLNTVSHFACYPEEWTEDARGQKGRIDLVLETDTCVIGVENKLFAGFQADQPRKYLDMLRNRASKLQNMRGYDHDYVVAVLGPTLRTEEIKQGLAGESSRCFYTPWEEVMKSLSRCVCRIDAETKSALRMFLDYLKDDLSFYPAFRTDMPHFKRAFPSGGSGCQRTLVGKIWRFMPGAGPRLSAAANWVGYSFMTGKEYGASTGWYGFLPVGERYFPDVALPDDRNAELVFVTNFHVKDLSGSFRPLSPFKGDFLGGENKDVVQAWALDIDRSWENAEKWEAELKPFHDAAEQQMVDTR